MQLRGLLFVGLFLGAEASSLRFRAAPNGHENVNIARQASESGSDSAGGSETTSAGDTISTTVEDVTTTTSDDTVSTTTTQPGSTTTTDEADTTITRTVTVTDANADTITTSTTIQKTITSTIIVTSTVFQTDTVTSTGETATETVYETSTQWANQKRAIDLAPRTVNPQGIVIVEAQATGVPEAEVSNDEHDLLRARNNLAKRATITKTVTATVGDSSGKTVTKSVTRTVISTASSVTKTTKTVTETEQEGASTTVTVTSTLVVTSTSLTTGVSTATSDSSSTTDSSSSDGSSSSGLSTGAKAGIGAGAGVAALVVLGIVLWCCFKRRNRPSKSELDDMFGSSEVPVGPSGGRDSTAHLSSTRMAQLSPTIPNVAPIKAPEGYRGTALGDGRAGFAKPKPYGAAYGGVPAVSPETNYSRTATTLSNGDERMDLPSAAAELGNDGNTAKWHHSNAAEIDGHQVAPRASSPQDPVYEMPAQPYR